MGLGRRKRVVVSLKFSNPFFVIWILVTVHATASDVFLSGADCSHLKFFEDRKIVYKEAGQTNDMLVILKNHGLNCVRLRLFTSSAAQARADAYNYTNNLAYTVPLAARVKNAGLQLLIDFHYSDTWADPSHQGLPLVWTNLPFAQLIQQMHDYNSNCIAAFNAANAMPDYVQVGNEITGGLLWPVGQVPGENAAAQWSQLGQLMKAAVQGIQDAAGTNMPKIIVHLDRGGDWNTTKWFFDNLNAQAVPFDIIGESFYPWWHGTLADLDNCLTNAAKRYNKPVIVAETAFPWTNSYWKTNIAGFSSTVTGQVAYAIALAKVVKNIPNGKGAGIFWWAAEYQRKNGVNEAGFNTTSFFDAGGNVLPVTDVFGEMVAPLILNSSVVGSNLSLHWPLSGAGMSLTTTTNPFAGSWGKVTNPIQDTGAVFNVTVPLDATRQRFFRLKSN